MGAVFFKYSHFSWVCFPGIFGSTKINHWKIWDREPHLLPLPVVFILQMLDCLAFPVHTMLFHAWYPPVLVALQAFPSPPSFSGWLTPIHHSVSPPPGSLPGVESAPLLGSPVALNQLIFMQYVPGPVLLGMHQCVKQTKILPSGNLHS